MIDPNHEQLSLSRQCTLVSISRSVNAGLKLHHWPE